MAFTEKYVTSAAAGGGDGSSGSPWTLAESINGVGASGGIAATAGDRVNVQSDAGYTLGLVTQLNVGTGTAPIIWRGYNSTIGDLEGQGRNADGTLNTTNFPAIDCTTLGRWAMKAWSIWQNLDITSAKDDSIFDANSIDNLTWISCSLTNTAVGTLTQCILADNSCSMHDCDFTCTGSTHDFVVQVDSNAIVVGCRFNVTANFGFEFHAATIHDSVFFGNVTNGKGIKFGSTSATPMLVKNCTFYELATAVETFNGSMTGVLTFLNNHVTDCTKWIDNPYVATANHPIIEINTRTRDNTTPRTGVGDFPNIGEITTDTGGHATDFVDATSDNFRLIATAPGKDGGLIAYQDCGAYQRQEAESNSINYFPRVRG